MPIAEELSFFEAFFSWFTAYILPATLGLVTGIASEKIKNKSLTLKYSLSFQSLGTVIQDRFWGDITIFHNNRAINHLNFVTLKISNNSGLDAKEPIELNVWLDPRSQFLGTKGNYNTGSAIYFEDNFNAQFEAVVTHPDIINASTDISIDLLNRLNFVQGNRIFNIPVFNRRSSLVVNFLIENHDGHIPNIYLDLKGKGIRLVQEEDAEKAENIKKIVLGGLNLLLYAIAMYWVFKKYPDNGEVIWVVIIWGVASYFFSLLLYYGYIYLKRLF